MKRILKKYFYFSWAVISLTLGYKYFIHFLDVINGDKLGWSCHTNITTVSSTKKLILLWTSTSFYSPISLKGQNAIYNEHTCPYSECEITFDRSRLCDSSVIVFHAFDTHFNDLPSPKYRLKHQRYVFFTQEPPYYNSKWFTQMNSYFNWTMTYRRDSDILISYISWNKRPSPILNTKTDYLNNRQARVLWLASNCKTHSRREDYIRRLSKVVPVTILGKCRNTISSLSLVSCGNLNPSDCTFLYAQNHTYYFAFENSFCLDYISEKYQVQVNMKRMIPIVYDTNENNNYKRLAIPNSYIDASQFESPEILGKYLNELVLLNTSVNTPKYKDYFQWINHYEVGFNNELDSRCELCKKIYLDDGSTKIYSNFKKWLFEDANCYRWSDNHNRSIKVPLSETITMSNHITDELLSIASI